MSGRVWDLSYVTGPDGRFMTLFIAGEGDAPTQEFGPYRGADAGPAIRDALFEAGLFPDARSAAYAYIGHHFRCIDQGKNLAGEDYPREERIAG